MARSSPKQLWANATWLLLGRVMVQALSFLLSLLLARQLGPAAFGQVSLILSVVYIGNVITTFGLDTLLLREIAANAHTPLLGTALRAQLMLSLLFVGAVGAAILLFGMTVWLWVYSLALFPLALMTVYSAVLRANERMERYLIGTVLVALLQVGGVALWGAALGPVIMWLLATQMIGGVIMAALAQTPIRSLSGAIWPILRESLWLVGLMVFSVLLQRWGVFALSVMGTPDEVGLFSAALRLTDVFRIVPYVVFGALFPSMARTRDGHIPPHLTVALVAAACVGAVLLSVGATPLMRLVYGTLYIDAVSVLRVLVWGIPLYILTGMLDLQLVSRGYEKRAAFAAGAGIIVTAVVTLLAYPPLDVVGVAAAIIAGEGFRMLLLRYNRKVIH